MKEYKGFKYEFKGTHWTLIYPSGFKANVSAADDAAMKAMIDKIESDYKK